jgi:hypothetical protein
LSRKTALLGRIFLIACSVSAIAAVPLASFASGSCALPQEEDATPAAAREQSAWSPAQLKFFETKIRPVLVDRCYGCHSDSAKSLGGGLRVDSREALLRGGDSGPALDLEHPAESLLWLALHYEDSDYAMPPESAGGKLPPETLKDFEQWLLSGAADPRRETEVGPDPGAGEAAREWWAWQPLADPQPPELPPGKWAETPLDHFVESAWQAQGLTPVPDASGTTLLRRVHFDLTGLPPTATQAREFAVAWQAAPDAAARQSLYEALVDDLLASPQFGEHWGRHWLDVARYAESSGKDVNVLYPYAWKYRDYVIEAFNADLPFDQFLREQIAGDLLPAADDVSRSRQLIATGFLALGPKSLNEQNPRQLAVDIADEQIDAVTQAFLGVTVSCARCHDHKFDPISQVEYTALAGIFLSTQTHYGTAGAVGGRNAGTLLTLPEENSVRQPGALSPRQVAERRTQLEELETQRRKLLAERRENREQNQNNELLRVTNQISAIRTVLAGYSADGERLVQAMGVSDKPSSTATARRSGRGALARLRNGNAFVSIGDSPLFERGELDRPTDRVPRGLPQLFPDIDVPKIPSRQSGRQQLAEWLTDPAQPLTRRVLANRVWYWLMGSGLVTSVDNFGTTGDTPSHPELLDYLAQQLQRSGWSVKSLVREIVLSRTYRLSSQHAESQFAQDPANRWLWRHSPRRLEAESIRDAILLASGQLNLSPPVASLVGENGDGVLGRQRFGLSENAIAQASSRHRSIYLPLTRDIEPEILGLFDYPDAAVVQGARATTNVPAQALFLLNSQFIEEQAKLIGRKYVQSEPAPRTGNRNRRRSTATVSIDWEGALDDLGWMLYGRELESAERAAAKKLVTKLKDDPAQAGISVIRALLAAAEFRSLD